MFDPSPSASNTLPADPAPNPASASQDRPIQSSGPAQPPEPDSDNDEPDHDSTPPEGNKRAKVAPKLACKRCRELKARCEVYEPKNGKCQRCTRLSFDCVWVESQKRGRKAGSTK